jgi:acetoin:2,6-dichlorophenolindophenol oxidoreductase subunit alpha
MRDSYCGITSDLFKEMPKETILELFRRMCLCRSFESEVFVAGEEKIISYPVYLSLGQEATAAALSMAVPDHLVFAQHRAHSTYLAFGGDPAMLRDELLGLPTGTSGGRAGSNCLQYHKGNINLYGHHGLIGENVPLGVGAALGSNKPTLCLFGDGAAEEDYVFAAMGFAVTHKLPVLFVCEDNNLSILTPVSVRRSWSMTKVAAALGMPAFDLSDDPWSILTKTRELKADYPAFLNIFTCRASWHVGFGTDNKPEWDRFSLVKGQLKEAGLEKEGTQIEAQICSEMRKLWDRKLLQKQ